MRSPKKSVQWVVRKTLAVAFWLQALGVVRLVSSFLPKYVVNQKLVLQISVIAAIFFYSYVADNAGWSMVVDALYVYVSPVVAFSRLSWKLIKRAGRSLAAVSPAIAALYDKPTAQQTQPPTETQREVPPQTESIPRFLARPLLHFSILWCVLISISDQRWILVISGSAGLAIAVSVINSLHRSLNNASTMMENFNLRLHAAVEKFVADLEGAAPSSKVFKDSITNVRVYGAIFRYLSSLEAVRKVTRKISLAVSIPTYIYTSLLCGFVYYDIAKIANIKWPLGEALIDALYMPIAFTDLPHNYAIRILGGLQVASLILIGYDAIFRRINDSMEKLSNAALGLSAMIETDSVRAALAVYEAQAAGEQTAEPEAAAPPLQA